MTFSSFAQMLYPIIGKGTTISDFIITLIDNIMENPVTDKDKQKQDAKEYNPLERVGKSTREKLYSGERELSKKAAGEIIAHIDKDKFETYLRQFSDDVFFLIYDSIKQKGEKISNHMDYAACIDIFVSILHERAKGVKKTNERLELAEKLKKLGEYELLSDLENINKQQETLKALLDLLDNYKCIQPYPHDIRKYMKEAKEFFSSKELKFYDSEIIRTVNEFHETYEKFEEYLATYYDKLKQLGEQEKCEHDERIIIEKRESLPIEMGIRQDLFIASIRRIIRLEGKLENTARAL